MQTYKLSKTWLSPVVVARAGKGLKVIKAKIKTPGLTENAVKDAIRWARGKAR